jgi:sugar phosphate isomerase/epimerase
MLYPTLPCPGGFEASFIQPNAGDVRADFDEWRRRLSLLRSIGVDTAVLQFSSDRDGPYPLRTILDAADTLGLKVFVGLHLDRRWPGRVPAIPAPLAWPDAVARLRDAARSPAFAGWYLSPEIDDESFGGRQGAAAARAFLARTSARLTAIAPAPVAAAPFFSGRQDPERHARWWDGILPGSGVTVLMLQDGVGVGRTTPEAAARYLAALAPVCARHGVRLWSVLEIFRQERPPPRFAAVPAPFDRIPRGIAAQRPHVERIAAFAVPSYMDPERGGAAAKLYRAYRAWCAGGTFTSPPAPRPAGAARSR